MLPSKHKTKRYATLRFKSLTVVEQEFKKWETAYSKNEIYELWTYFVKRSEKELLFLAKCSDALKDRELYMLNTADLLRYCYGNIQMVLLNIIERDFPMP